MTCDNHYPIIGSWTIIVDEVDYTTWQCPNCKETHTSKRHKGKLDIVPDRIKEDRAKNRDVMLQPHRDGQFSKEFAEKYPQATKQMIKDGSVTQKEVSKAKNVWTD